MLVDVHTQGQMPWGRLSFTSIKERYLLPSLCFANARFILLAFIQVFINVIFAFSRLQTLL